MVTTEQIEEAKNFLGRLLEEFGVEEIKVIPELSGDCSFYVFVKTSISVDDEDRLDESMDGLLAAIPYIPDHSFPFVFLKHRNKVIYSWVGRPS